VKKVENGQAEGLSEKLNSRGKIALYNNLNQNEELALKIDEAVKKNRPDSWRDIRPKQQIIRQALFDILKDEAEVERIFKIIDAQKEY